MVTLPIGAQVKQGLMQHLPQNDWDS